MCQYKIVKIFYNKPLYQNISSFLKFFKIYKVNDHIIVLQKPQATFDSTLPFREGNAKVRQSGKSILIVLLRFNDLKTVYTLLSNLRVASGHQTQPYDNVDYSRTSTELDFTAVIVLQNDSMFELNCSTIEELCLSLYKKRN